MNNTSSPDLVTSARKINKGARYALLIVAAAFAMLLSPAFTSNTAPTSEAGRFVHSVVAPQPAAAADNPYRIPQIAGPLNGPGITRYYAYSKQDGWRGPWRVFKASAHTDAVEHWGNVTGGN